MNYAKGRYRARPNYEGVAATIHTKECYSVITNGSDPLPDSLHLNQEQFLLHDIRDASFQPPRSLIACGGAAARRQAGSYWWCRRGG